MVHIVADTSTLYSSEEARDAGFAVSPLAVTHVSRELTAHGVGEGWRLYVTHAAAPALAETARAALAQLFPAARLDVMMLTPAFITQGGPGCVAIQAIREG